MRKIVETRDDFNIIEIVKMYDDESLLCNLVTEVDGEEVSRTNLIGFERRVWSEFITLTDEEIKELLPFDRVNSVIPTLW